MFSFYKFASPLIITEPQLHEACDLMEEVTAAV